MTLLHSANSTFWSHYTYYHYHPAFSFPSLQRAPIAKSLIAWVKIQRSVSLFLSLSKGEEGGEEFKGLELLDDNYLW